MSKQVKVSEIPNCDICHEKGYETIAFADAKLDIGPWANVCRAHFAEYRCALGTGAGQEYVQIDSAPSELSGKEQQDERIRENMRGMDLNTMTLEDFEDMFEDRDPMEFL